MDLSSCHDAPAIDTAPSTVCLHSRSLRHLGMKIASTLFFRALIERCRYHPAAPMQNRARYSVLNQTYSTYMYVYSKHEGCQRRLHRDIDNDVDGGLSLARDATYADSY